MTTVFRYLLCALLASLVVAQVSLSLTVIDGVTVTLTISVNGTTTTTTSSSVVVTTTPSTTPSETPSTTPSATPSTTPSEPPSTTPSATPSTTPSEPPSTTPSATQQTTPSSEAPPPSSSSSEEPPPSSSSEAPPPSSSSAEAASPTSETVVYIYSSVSSSVAYQETFYSTENVVVTTQPDGQTSQRTEYTVVQTTVPATTLYATTVVTSVESPTGIAGLQTGTLSGSGGGGLSTGAKAGIGAGVGVLVVGAAIFGALYAMRRRRHNDRIAEHDRYSQSTDPAYMGAVGALGKRNSRYTESELYTPQSPPMRETNPLDRYATPAVSSQKTTMPPNSRTSDISSITGSESNTYRPGPGMPVVAEYQRHNGAEELPEQNNFRPHNEYLSPSAANYHEAEGNPFHEKGGDNTPSLYSEDGDHNGGVNRYPSHRQASPAALELSADNTMAHTLSNSSGGQGYRGVDPEQPYHTRTHLTKPPSPPRQYDPSHNF